MEQNTVPTWYVSRRLNVPLDEAGPVFDAVVGEEPGRRRWGSLVLPDRSVQRIGPQRSSDRRIDGRLHLPLRRPAHVELELVPWSADTSEIGLRPVGVPRAARGPTYFAAAFESLDALRVVLEQSAGEVTRSHSHLERAS